MKTTNRNCRQYVQAKNDFTAHQLYAETKGKVYTVYSYGPHWPLFACIDGVWYENADKHSMTTSNQHSRAHPLRETIKVSCSELKALINAS